MGSMIAANSALQKGNKMTITIKLKGRYEISVDLAAPVIMTLLATFLL